MSIGEPHKEGASVMALLPLSLVTVKAVNRLRPIDTVLPEARDGGTRTERNRRVASENKVTVLDDSNRRHAGREVASGMLQAGILASLLRSAACHEVIREIVYLRVLVIPEDESRQPYTDHKAEIRLRVVGSKREETEDETGRVDVDRFLNALASSGLTFGVRVWVNPQPDGSEWVRSLEPI